MSSPLKQQTHLHEYERSKANLNIYRCIHPDCTHYQKREYLVGKRAQCHKCKDSFILMQEQLKSGRKIRGIKFPVCIKCSKSPKAKDLIKLEDILVKELNELFPSIEEKLENEFDSEVTN